MKDTFYFSHDYNTRNDGKIKKLIAAHGFEGYGLFWAILEELYNNDNLLSTDYSIIVSDRKAKVKIIKSIVEDFELFMIKDGTFGSISVENRINERKLKSSRARESANLRWNAIKDDANALPSQTDRNAIKERKGKDKKGKERIVTDVVPFDKSKGCYQECISLYNQFLIDRTGAGVKMNGREGKSMNTIIDHLSRQDKIAGDKQKIIDAWNYILVNWDSLTTYHKNRVKLSNIDEDLSNILLQLKQKNNTPPNESTAEKFRDLIRSQSTGSVQQPNTVNDVFSSTQNGDGTQ